MCFRDELVDELELITGGRKLSFLILLLKGGNPAAPSGTATLLRLSPSQRSCFRRRGGFEHSLLPWLDGRCVQGPGTYSPWCADPRLLAIPASRSRVADSDPN